MTLRKGLFSILFLLFFVSFSCSESKESALVASQESANRKEKTDFSRRAEKEDVEAVRTNDEESNQNKPKSAEEKFKEANASIADSFKEHGRDAVLRAGDKLNQNELRRRDYKINEPDLSKPPRPLNYKGLKKVYTYFRLKEKLPKEVVDNLNGTNVIMTGAVMPVEKIPENGELGAFWLANPTIVLAGCVFCNPPTLADIVYVYKDSGQKPFKFEREKLFKQILLARVTGRLFFGPETINGQTFLQSILAEDVVVLN